MKYVYTFNEINSGHIEIEADHRPEKGEIIEKILEGKASYHNADFTDFCLVETNGEVTSAGGDGMDSLGSYSVTITETLRLTVEVEAENSQEAEQMVADSWHNSEYVLDADNFVGVDFTVIYNI